MDHSSTRIGLRILALVFFLSLGLEAVMAQSAGKLTGEVRDAATGETLPGASVFLEENTSLGAATDIDGRYFLLGVPPGDYTVVVSMVGYATLRTANVEVFSGRTTEVNAQLSEAVIEGAEVTVVAERPIVVRDRTNTVSFVDQDAITKLPVQEVGDVIVFQPGVVQGQDGGLHIRGGRSRENAYIIDGVPVQDVFTQGGGSTVDLEVQSVQELQVFTGTFDAELGGAQSGVVSVTTRDPGRNYTGNARVMMGGFAGGTDEIFIGGASYSATETADVSATFSGPLLSPDLGFFVTGRYVNRSGHLKGERRFTTEDGFVIGTYRRWYRDVYEPTDTRLIALDTARAPSGELILDRDGNPQTFTSGDFATIDMDRETRWTINPKLVWRPGQRTRIAYAGVINSSETAGFDVDLRYSPDGRATNYLFSHLHTLSFKQTYGSNKVLSLRGSYRNSEIERYAFQDPSDPGIQYINPTDDVTGFALGGTFNGHDRRTERQFLVSGDYLWQINESNEFKTGFQFRSDRFIEDDLDRSWVHADNPDSLFLNLNYPPATNFAFFEDYLEAVRGELPILVPELEELKVDDSIDQNPMEFAFFVQDKLEFDNRLVVKAGLRFEVFDIGEQHLIDPRTPTDRIGRDDNFEDTPAKTYLSPRLGISFPISSAGAFRVAYGHFVQMPAYQELLKNPIFTDINVGQLEDRRVGNPDLEPEKTIKYEMGLQQQVNNFVGIDVSLFYKDIRNLLGEEIIGTLDNVQYQRTVNRDYGNVRGASFALATRPIGLLLGSSFDVTYASAKGSSSDPEDVADIAVVGRSGEVGDFVLERNIIALNWDQQWTVNLSTIIGKSGNWNVGFIGQLASGQPYTPTFLDPTKSFPDNAFDNTELKPTFLTFDINAEKQFRVGNGLIGLRVQFNNIVNVLNERTVDSISGRSGQIIREQVVQEDREFVNDFVGLFTQAEDDNRPQWYGPPREVLFAITFTP